LLGITPSSANRKTFGLRGRNAASTSRRVGRRQPVIFSTVFLIASISGMAASLGPAPPMLRGDRRFQRQVVTPKSNTARPCRRPAAPLKRVTEACATVEAITPSRTIELTMMTVKRWIDLERLSMSKNKNHYHAVIAPVHALEHADATIEQIQAWLLAERGVKVSVGCRWNRLQFLGPTLKKSHSGQ